MLLCPSNDRFRSIWNLQHACLLCHPQELHPSTLAVWGPAVRLLSVSIDHKSVCFYPPQEAACQRAEIEAAAAWLQAEAMRVTITRIGAQYRAFFTWLLKTGERGGLGHIPYSGGHCIMRGVAVATYEKSRQFRVWFAARSHPQSHPFPPTLLPPVMLLDSMHATSHGIYSTLSILCWF